MWFILETMKIKRKGNRDVYITTKSWINNLNKRNVQEMCFKPLATMKIECTKFMEKGFRIYCRCFAILFISVCVVMDAVK